MPLSAGSRMTPWARSTFRPVSACCRRPTIMCGGNNQVVIGEENYFCSGDGLLMPTKNDQAPPDLRYFEQSQK